MDGSKASLTGNVSRESVCVEVTMSKRETPRLAYFGEYFVRDPESSEPVYRARLLLLGELRKVLPLFFEKLVS